MKAELTRYEGRGQVKLNGTKFRVAIDEKSNKAVYLYYNDINGDKKSVGLSKTKSIEFECEDIPVKSIGDVNLIKIADYLKRQIQRIVDDPKVLDKE